MNKGNSIFELAFVALYSTLISGIGLSIPSRFFLSFLLLLLFLRYNLRPSMTTSRTKPQKRSKKKSKKREKKKNRKNSSRREEREREKGEEFFLLAFPITIISSSTARSRLRLGKHVLERMPLRSSEREREAKEPSNDIDGWVEKEHSRSKSRNSSNNE